MSGIADYQTLDRDTFILSNLGLVGEIAKKYIHTIQHYPIVDYDDLKQIGAIGLIKAYDNFKPEYGNQFSTYAVPMIDGEIKRFFRDNLETIKFPRQVKLDYYKIYNAGLLDEEPEIISEKINIPLDRVKKAKVYGENKITNSLHQTVHDSDSDSLDISGMIGHEVDFDTKLEVELFLSKLDDRTRKVVELRLKGLTQKQIGEKIGVSQMTVGRILNRLKEQLQGGVECMSNETFREELVKGIIEVAQNTGLTVNQCVYEAKQMLKEQMKEHYRKKTITEMFKGW